MHRSANSESDVTGVLKSPVEGAALTACAMMEMAYMKVGSVTPFRNALLQHPTTSGAY